MSRLQDFLALPKTSEITEEIYVNERIGTLTIKPMTEQQFNNYRQRAKRGKKESEIDLGRFQMLIITGQVIDPNFSDADFLAKAGCSGASDFIAERFLAGEVADVSNKIIKASGFDNDINADLEEIKNS